MKNVNQENTTEYWNYYGSLVSYNLLAYCVVSSLKGKKSINITYEQNSS